MVWLYKGAYSCSYELGTGKPTLEFLSYPLRMLRMLKSKRIKTICVFDGFHLKAKEATELTRIEFKKKNGELGMLNEENGHHEEARKHFSRSLTLRTAMVYLFMDILNEL